MDDDFELEQMEGDVPDGVGPEVFREQLERVAQHPEHRDAHITLHDERLYLDDIQDVEQESDTGRARIRLRNGVIIGGLTGAAIVAALATIRYRRRHRE